MEVIFSDRSYLAIITETCEKIKVETGGIFLGCYENGCWYVVEAIDPGPKSIFQASYFEYDQQYTTHLINKIALLYQSKLSLIGLWHRHPGSFDEFSSTDDDTNSDYAKLGAGEAISVLVNIDPKLRITPYHVSWPLKYSRIDYRVGDNLIPEYLLKLKNPKITLQSASSHADQSSWSMANPKLDFVHLLDKIKPELEPVSYEVTSEDLMIGETGKYRDIIFDSLIEDIEYLAEKLGLTLKIEHSAPFLCLSHKNIDGTITEVDFAYIVEREQVMFYYCDAKYFYEPRLFSKLLANRVSA